MCPGQVAHRSTRPWGQGLCPPIPGRPSSPSSDVRELTRKCCGWGRAAGTIRWPRGPSGLCTQHSAHRNSSHSGHLHVGPQDRERVRAPLHSPPLFTEVSLWVGALLGHADHGALLPHPCGFSLGPPHPPTAMPRSGSASRAGGLWGGLGDLGGHDPGGHTGTKWTLTPPEMWRLDIPVLG